MPDCALSVESDVVSFIRFFYSENEISFLDLSKWPLSDECALLSRITWRQLIPHSPKVSLNQAGTVGPLFCEASEKVRRIQEFGFQFVERR